MNKKLRIAIRFILIPLLILTFIIYLPIWYVQMSWYYFSFSDYWDGYSELLNRVMRMLKL